MKDLEEGRMNVFARVIPLAFGLILACSGSRTTPGSADAAAVSVVVTPKVALVKVSGTSQFAATVNNASNTAVSWSVVEGAAGGSVSSSGAYAAPTVTGTFHVMATSQADATKTDTAEVTVAQEGVVVSPATASLSYGGQKQFAAAVTGLTDTSVTWVVKEGANGGTITSTGLYSAPSATGTFHVSVTSNADTTQSDLATIAVTAPAGTPPTLTAGIWANLSSPQMTLGSGQGPKFGIAAFDFDPGTPYVIYVCVDQDGLWKTVDGGSTWTQLGDSTKVGSTTTQFLDSPIAVRVDPNNSNHLIATQGVRGNTLGFWVSQDGGKNWTMPAGFVSTAPTRDVTTLAVDPSDFNHLLVGSHSAWPGLTNAGILESKDGGASWIVHQPVAGFASSSMGIAFLYDPALGIGNAQTWLVGTDSNGLWRTTDSGASFTRVTPNTGAFPNFSITHAGNQLYYTSNGYLYTGLFVYPARSKDNGLTWEFLPGFTYASYYSVVGDGKNLYTQLAYTGDNAAQGLQSYRISPETDGLAWTVYDPLHQGPQTFTDGPFMMKFDRGRGILYSANWNAGFWALKVLP
jgi:hypothetical protein